MEGQLRGGYVNAKEVKSILVSKRSFDLSRLTWDSSHAKDCILNLVRNNYSCLSALLAPGVGSYNLQHLEEGLFDNRRPERGRREDGVSCSLLG